MPGQAGRFRTVIILPRLAATRVASLLGVFPVTVVTGARQTGKSTLVRQPEVIGTRTYITLDNVLVRDQARTDPEVLLERAEHLVIDEVQHAPDLLLAIKRRVDEQHVRGQYILTGSANLLLQRTVSESLAGRAGYTTLWPFTRREQLGFGTPGVWSELLVEAPSRWPDLLGAGGCRRSRGSRWRGGAAILCRRTSWKARMHGRAGSTVTSRPTSSAT